MKTIMPWVSSRHPQNSPEDVEFESYLRQLEMYKELSDDADRAMAAATILGTLLFGVLMILVVMYRGGMILI
jgi:hypothetical protein